MQTRGQFERADFLCKEGFIMEEYIKSPLNYTGGKYKILNYIIPFFPENIGTFIDLFGGGFNVGVNVNAQKIIYNDHNIYLSQMFEYFKQYGVNIIEKIYSRIKEFKLSEENQQGYLTLRKIYNEQKDVLDLFILTCYSFNHQIRFNSRHEFNTPFGKNRSEYNKTIEENLIRFINAIKNKNIEFYSKDFTFLYDFSLNKNDFVYADPPYLISNASYNDGKRGFKNWGVNEETQLLDLLDYLNNKGIKFALSNVIVHKGLENTKLIEWSKKYNIKLIKKSYNNSNYQRKNKDKQTKEVLIYN